MSKVLLNLFSRPDIIEEFYDSFLVKMSNNKFVEKTNKREKELGVVPFLLNVD